MWVKVLIQVVDKTGNLSTIDNSAQTHVRKNKNELIWAITWKEKRRERGKKNPVHFFLCFDIANFKIF